jgi:hypothetical protein
MDCNFKLSFGLQMQIYQLVGSLQDRWKKEELIMKKSAVINKISNTDIIDKHTDSVQIYRQLHYHYTHIT